MVGKKKKITIAAALAMTAVLAAGGAGYTVLRAEQTTTSETTYRETAVQSGNLKLTFEEEGTTQVSAVSQIPEFNVGTVKLIVDEVYVEAGDTVEEGDALLKLTNESVEEATAYYEKAVSSAESTLKTAQADYESGKLDAEYDRQDATLALESAETTYNTSISDLDIDLADKKEAYEEASESLETYQSNLDNNTYYTNAGIEDKETAISDAEEANEKAQKAFSEAEEDYQTATDAFESLLDELEDSDAEKVSELRSEIAELASRYKTLQSVSKIYASAEQAATEAETTLQQANETLTTAQKEYEENQAAAEAKVTELSSSVTELEQKYNNALLTYDTEKLAIQNTYDAAVLEGNNAETVYQAALAELQKTVDEAQETLDDLKEEQAAFLSLENGVITAEQAGTLASVTYEAGDTLFSNVAAVSYYSTGTITISVEVDQSDIAKIEVGDEVSVAISGSRDSLTGTVQSIASSATTGGSVSNVTYAVVIAIDNSDGRLSLGASAEITFEYGEYTDVIYVEADAVKEGSDGTGTVLMYDENGEAAEQTVTIGESTKDYVIITDGLSEGDICLIETGGEK